MNSREELRYLSAKNMFTRGELKKCVHNNNEVKMENDVIYASFVIILYWEFASELRNRVLRRHWVSRTETLKTAKMEVKIEVPLLSKVAHLRPQRWRLSTALFPAFA